MYCVPVPKSLMYALSIYAYYLPTRNIKTLKKIMGHLETTAGEIRVSGWQPFFPQKYNEYNFKI